MVKIAGQGSIGNKEVVRLVENRESGRRIELP
jgi:hypothetical protein